MPLDYHICPRAVGPRLHSEKRLCVAKILRRSLPRFFRRLYFLTFNFQLSTVKLSEVFLFSLFYFCFLVMQRGRSSPEARSSRARRRAANSAAFKWPSR